MRRRRKGHDQTGSTPVAESGRADGRRRPEPLVTKGRKGKRGGAVEAPPVARRSRVARHPVVLIANMILAVVVAAVVGGVAVLVVGQRMYAAEGPLTEDVGVVIERGSSVQSIAQGLEEQGVISNQFVFLAAAYGTGATARIQAGEYVIPALASMEEVLDRVVSGTVVQHTITFAEGLTSAQIVARILDDDILSGPVTEIPPEGSLLPETYNYGRGMTRERLIELMRAAHDRALEEVWQGRDADLPLRTPQQLVTLASIVEKETGVAAERPRVASVFVNRLNRNMRLQSDPTILYGLHGGEAWSQPRTITRFDLERVNPYNTYQIPALPPGPIANPGVAAMRATANPAATPDLYFVADGSGGHAFARSYEAHQQNVARWRQIEGRRGPVQTGPTQ